MGDQSCFMQLPGGAPVAGGAGQGKSSNYAAKALQEEEFCFGANAHSKPQASRPKPAAQETGVVDAGDRSCFLGPPK